jgi:hypothetical protein
LGFGLAKHLAVARRFKGVANVLDCRRAFGLGPRDGDDVEASAFAEQVVAFEPRQRESRESALLAGIDGLGWMAAVMGAARLDFDEHDGPPIDGDEIDFAQTATGAPIDNRKTLAAEKAFRGTFALQTEGGGAEPFRERREKSRGDSRRPITHPCSQAFPDGLKRRMGSILTMN